MSTGSPPAAIAGLTSLPRRVRRWVRGRRTVSAPATDHVDPLLQQRTRATRLWTTGRREASVDLLRGLLLEHSRDVATWHIYGSRSLQLRRPDVAVEAARNALTISPTHLPSLELLLQLAERTNKVRVSVRKEALNALSDALPDRPELHEPSLPFVLAAKHETALALLAHSPVPVVQLAVRLHRARREEWSVLLEDEPDGVAALAHAQVLLARGGASQAADLLAGVPTDDLPVRAIRMTIRRALRAGHPGRAQALLRQYRRARPDDAWAKAKLAETELSDTASQELLTNGFPMPAPAPEPAFPATGGSFFYTLHNSLPYHSAGYASRTHGLLTALRDQGWRPNGVTRLGYPYDMPGQADLGPIPEMDSVDGVAYHRLSTTPVIERKMPLVDYVDRYSTALESLVRRERPFLLHGASNHWNGLAAVATARRLGLPSVYEVRGLWEITRSSRDPFWGEGQKFKMIARMEADAARFASRTIAITGALRDELIRRGVPEEQVVLVPNGVDTDRFVPRQRDEELAARLGVSGKTVIGYVGSVLDYEGLGLLVEAAGVLAGEREDFVVLVVGDGGERVKLERQVARAGLGSVVRFLGRVPHEEVESYYSIMDVCPLPRLPLPVCEMVSPLKPFEAMAMGKVVVASDVAALAEIVGDGVTGLLHEKGSAASLASRLRLLLDDEQLRVRLSVQAREWVVAHRRWDVLARRVAAIYEELGGRPRPTAA